MFYIYLLENKINHKKYVGQTNKDEPAKRWKNGNGYKGQDVIWDAIQKYGWNNFSHTILEKVSTQKEANEKEKYYISFYNCLACNHNGYNVAEGGTNGYPLAGYSNEQKQAYAEKQSRIGKQRFENNPELKQKMSDISRAYWVEENKRKASLQKKKYYKQNPEKLKKLLEQGESLIEKVSIPVKCIETKQEFKSISEAGRWANVSGECISLYLKGKEKYAGRHPETGQRLHWCYPNDNIEELEKKIYNIVCIETNECFETAVEAGKKYQVDSSALCKHLNHPETYKSCGKHPITQQRLHWKRYI